MAITVKHTKVSTIPDAGDASLIEPSDWNADHQLVGTVPVANGGTGASTLTGYVVGNGTSAMTAATTIPNTDVTGLGTMSTQNSNNISVTGGSISGVTVLGYIPTSAEGVANGVATLDSGGQIPLSQIPPLGDLNYQGTWNATTNTPTLTSSVGTKGYYYVVSVAGTTNLNGITDWQISDWAVFNGSVWQKIDNTDLVTSVNGYTGTVNLTYTDVGAFPATSTTGTGNVVLATGATQAHPIISDYEAFTSTTPPSYAEGRVWFDSGNHTLAQYNDVTNNIVHLGEEVQLKVINNTGSSIPNGSPVYITSTSSGQTYPNIALAKADTLATSNVIGLTNGAIANGQAGYVTTIGLLNPANTGTFAVGDVLYLSPYSAGQIMNTLPPTGYPVRLGIVAYSNNPNGAIYITKTNVYSLAANIVGTVAVANGGTGATTLTGYVKGSGTSAMTASSTIPTTDLSGTVTNAQLANSSITINGTSTSLGGSISVGTVTSVAATAGTGISISGSPITTSGTLTVTNTAPDQTVVLTAGTGISTSGTYPNFTITNTSPSSGGTVTSVTGTSPVVSSGGNTPAISMPAATTSVSGYLTSTDWNIFNGKQAAGTYVNSVSGTTGRITSTGGVTPVIDLASGVATAGTTGSSTLIPVVTIDTYGRVTSITTASNPQGTVTSVTGTAPVVSSGGATPAISMAAANTTTNGYLTSTDWNTFNGKSNTNGTVTSVAALTLGTTGTDLSSTVATGTTTPVITLQVPTASATNRGALSSADWTTFNGKAPSVTYTTNYVPYGQGTTTPNQSSSYTFDGTTQTAPIQRASNGIVVNSKTVSASYSIASGDNAMSAGPITVASGQSVTVASGSRWVIL